MTIGWGIVGTGPVAEGFAQALHRVPGARAVAVTSARPERATAFAKAHGFSNTHADVAALAADPAVDVVYVASPTRLHLEHGLAVIAAGKALLCEKPFTGDPDDAARLVAAARAANVFCMEAMWLRFNDRIAELKAAIDGSAIGAPAKMIMAIGYAQDPATYATPEARLGALPVFGCYGISLAWRLFGAPADWRADLRRNAAGVDVDAAVTLTYPGLTVEIDASVAATRANRLEIQGNHGTATIPRDVIDPAELVIGSPGSADLRARIAARLAPVSRRLSGGRGARGSGFRGEIVETMRCMTAGLPESPMMPHEETVAIQSLIAKMLATI